MRIVIYFLLLLHQDEYISSFTMTLGDMSMRDLCAEFEWCSLRLSLR